MTEKTSKLGVNTKEGFILNYKTMKGSRYPVKLDFKSDKEESLYAPLKENGKLVFALPGGR